MRTVRLGRTGLKISEICLGTMTFGLQTDRGESFDIMDAAEYAGIDFFDVADVYPGGGTPETAGARRAHGGDGRRMAGGQARPVRARDQGVRRDGAAAERHRPVAPSRHGRVRR